MKNISSLDLFVIIAYLVGIVGVGCYAGLKRARNPARTATSSRRTRSAGDKSSTSIVGGLFYADNMGQALLSGFSSRLWFGFRIDEITLAPNTNAYGWRDTHPYSVVRGAGATPFARYPSFYKFKLMQYFARGGDTVVTVTNSSPLLTTYAVKRTNGALALLVINKSPTLNLTGNFNLTGYTADLSATAC